MTNEIILQNLEQLNSDPLIQNLVAQANARYILLNTSESNENFPPYTIKDHNLNVLALHYLNLGSCLAENQKLADAASPLEKGASILEAVHAVQGNRKETSSYYGIIASMAYYVSFQYSKSFILIAKFETTTVIGNLIRLFLQRNFRQLDDEIFAILVDGNYSDTSISETFEEEGNIKIYENVIARALDGFIKYYHSGDLNVLERAKTLLRNTKEIALIERDPGIWWIIRLLILISDGFDQASLWNALGGYFDLRDKQVDSYIRSLIFMEPRGIYELFITQRHSLSKVLDLNQSGCVVSIPTSSGKTRTAEIAILHCIRNSPDGKVLYIAPFRSLAFEVENGLERVFEHAGISISHLYGGSLYSKLDEMAIEDSQVIIATPEKAKAILRGNIDLFRQINLVVIDEGHLLGPEKRMIMNEIFYEELRYHLQEHGGRFLLLSAVLPNAEDIAQWLTESRDTVYRENWRPSDERLGILEWSNGSVNLNWESLDTERASFNRRFIDAIELPRVKYQRKDTIKYYPEDKNEAVAATAYKLRTFGPVLIFVGRKDSVFVMAKAYFKALGNDNLNHPWKNASDWRSYELACLEAYGEDNLWLSYAKRGVLCHNSDLHGDVRLPLERLMRADKPLVIISTSTLGQGVNLGISTVIFSTLHQNGGYITARDFWNIAGRAGRAFVDHEGKILVALDTNGTNVRERQKLIREVKEYFDKDKIDIARSGILILIKALKQVADDHGTDFDLLLQLITENRIEVIGNVAAEIEDTLDWIDDTLLSLLLANNPEGEIDISWVEAFFNRSLAVIQAENVQLISGDEIEAFLKARIEGIVEKVGEDRLKWRSIVQSGIPLNSDLLLEDRMDQLISIVQTYMLVGDTIEDKIELIKEIEFVIKDLPVLIEKKNYLDFKNIDEIRDLWIKAKPTSEILTIDGGLEVITKMYSFSLPWILNGISKKMRNRDLEKEADCVEEIAILVESGLPSIEKVKIYQAGIRSRTAANELGVLFDEQFEKRSIAEYKNEFLNNAADFTERVSPRTVEWLTLLGRYAGRNVTKLKRIDPFTFDDDTHEKTTILLAKVIKGNKYLASPDGTFISKSWGDFDFSTVANIPGIEFKYNSINNDWHMVNYNPYVHITK